MQYLTPATLAKRWELSPRTLERWRMDGHGPYFMKLGGQVRYPLDEVENFEREHMQVSTGLNLRDLDLVEA